MNTDYSVTVVVAAYNSGEYINNCLESLKSQSLSSIEVLIVVDGSNDPIEKSIIKKYTQENRNFRAIFNEKNMGTGYSRERGIYEAKGKYIGFLDTDDYVEKETYKKLFNLAEQTNSEIAVADYHNISSTGISYTKDEKNSCTTKLYSGIDFFEFQISRIKKPFYLRVDWWNKIYKKSLFTKHNVELPRVVRNEGTMSMIMSLLSERVAVLDEKLFITVARTGSVCRTFKEKNITDIIESIKHFKKWLLALGHLENFEEKFIQFFYFVVFNHNIQLINKLTKEERNNCLDLLIEKILEDTKFRMDFYKYLNRKEKKIERLIYSTISNKKNYQILNLAKQTDFYERKEGGQRLTERSKYNKHNKEIVSVITICKDIFASGRKDFFDKMIDSVMKQTYGREKIEHIIIDAASQDGTQSYLEELANQGKIDYWVSEMDSGIYNAMNKGIKYHLGDYVIYMNTDDYFSESAIQNLVSAIKHNNADYAFANAIKIDDNDNRVGSHIGDMDKVFYGAPYCHQTLLCKSDCFTKVKFDESFRITMWDFSISLMMNNFKSSFVNESLAYFRVGGVSTNSTHAIKFAKEQTKIKIEKIVPLLDITYEEYEFLNSTFRGWPTKEGMVDELDLYKKLQKMLCSEDSFKKSFTESTLRLLNLDSENLGNAIKIGTLAG